MPDVADYRRSEPIRARGFISSPISASSNGVPTSSSSTIFLSLFGLGGKKLSRSTFKLSARVVVCTPLSSLIAGIVVVARLPRQNLYTRPHGFAFPSVLTKFRQPASFARSNSFRYRRTSFRYSDASLSSAMLNLDRATCPFFRAARTFRPAGLQRRTPPRVFYFRRTHTSTQRIGHAMDCRAED